MKTKRLSTIASLLTACALAFCLCGFGINPQRVGAESNKAPKKRSKSDKISPSLSRQGRSDDELVQIILQLHSAPSGKLKSLLRRAGIRVKNEFAEFNSSVVELPLSVVERVGGIR